MSVKDLLQVQYGKETTWGTGVAGSVKRMGVTDFEQQPEVDAAILEELRGSLAAGFVAKVKKTFVSAKETGWCTYEDIPYLLDSLLGVATPSGVGPYTRQYSAPLGSAPTLRYNSILWGDSTGSYRLVGGLLAKLNIKVGAAAEWQYTADWLGKAIAAQALASLSDRTVNPIMANQTTLYIDAWGGTLGATAFTKGFMAELEIDNRINLKHYIGQLQPQGFAQPKLKGTLKLTLEYDATSKAWLEEFMAADPLVQKQLRLKASDTANRDQTLDFTGTALKAPKVFDFEDETAVIKVDFEGVYHTTFANWFKATNINEVAALP